MGKNEFRAGKKIVQIGLLSCPTIACLTVLFLIVGCSASDRGVGELEVMPASGRVLYHGKPLEDAFLSLHPVAAASVSESMPLPRAQSKADGTFQLSTYRTADGAPPGKYQVAISWSGPLKGLTEDQKDRLPEKLPRKFTRPETSGIVIEIGDAETTLPAIELN